MCVPFLPHKKNILKMHCIAASHHSVSKERIFKRVKRQEQWVQQSWNWLMFVKKTECLNFNFFPKPKNATPISRSIPFEMRRRQSKSNLSWMELFIIINPFTMHTLLCGMKMFVDSLSSATKMYTWFKRRKKRWCPVNINTNSSSAYETMSDFYIFVWYRNTEIK
jgi:hypothetical protein